MNTFVTADGIWQHASDGKWHHVAVLFDGATWTTYVDGERQ